MIKRYLAYHSLTFLILKIFTRVQIIHYDLTRSNGKLYGRTTARKRGNMIAGRVSRRKRLSKVREGN